MLKQMKLKQSQILSLIMISALCGSMVACGPTRKAPGKTPENKTEAGKDGTGTQKGTTPGNGPGTQAGPTKPGETKPGDSNPAPGALTAASIEDVEYRVDLAKKIASLRIKASDAKGKSMDTVLMGDVSSLGSAGVELKAAPGSTHGYTVVLTCDDNSCRNAKATLTVAAAPTEEAKLAQPGSKEAAKDSKDGAKDGKDAGAAEPAKIVITLKQTQVKNPLVNTKGEVPAGDEAMIATALDSKADSSTELTTTKIEGGAQLFNVEHRLARTDAPENPAPGADNLPGDQIVLVKGKIAAKSLVTASYSTTSGDVAAGKAIEFKDSSVEFNEGSNTVTVITTREAGISKMAFGDNVN